VEIAGLAVASGPLSPSGYLDRHIDGSHSDIPSLGLVTVVALAGIRARIRATKEVSRRCHIGGAYLVHVPNHFRRAYQPKEAA
jgi:hypothetical protein